MRKPSSISTCRQNRLEPFTPRFDQSEYFDRAHVRGLGFLVGGAGVFGGYEQMCCCLFGGIAISIAMKVFLGVGVQMFHII